MKHNERMDSISRQDLKRARGDFNTFSNKIKDMDGKTAMLARINKFTEKSLKGPWQSDQT